MDEVLNAIDRSIAKWQDVVYKNNYNKNSQCPLCDLFAGECDDDDLDCKECPIRAFTGQTTCYGTPFYKSSVWCANHDRPVTAASIKASNDMLIMLHELRRVYITGNWPEVEFDPSLETWDWD